MSDAPNDGGQAFPRTVQRWNDSLEHVQGMSLRDWFAGKALWGVIILTEDARRDLGDDWLKMCARDAYRAADAMLAAREGRE